MLLSITYIERYAGADTAHTGSGQVMHCIQWKVVLQLHARKKVRLKGTGCTKSLWVFPKEERMHTMAMNDDS